MSVSRKHDDDPVSTALEARGLAWLAEAMVDDGAHAVSMTSGPDWLGEPRLTTTAVTPAGTKTFGRVLTVTHAAGTLAFGATPPGWNGQVQIDRSGIRLRPHVVKEGEPRRWDEFYAEDWILSYPQSSRDNGSISVGGARIVERLCERLRGDDFDTDQPALVHAGVRERGARVAVARTHGDLWCGNVLWALADETAQWAPRRAGPGPQGLNSWQALISRTAGGPTVVDMFINPMTQGAHAETDLAALGVSRQHYLDRIYAACHEASPPTEGWCERVGLHSWHVIMIHAFFFGGGHGEEAVAVVRQYL